MYLKHKRNSPTKKIKDHITINLSIISIKSYFYLNLFKRIFVAN